MASTFNEMKKDIETGWEVIWSESYGIGDAAVLTACVAYGCAQAYLEYKLNNLVEKVGTQFIEQTLKNKGKVLFGPGDLEVQAGDAYWSVTHKIWNPIKWRHEKVTTERYVRLYIRYRRRNSGGQAVSSNLGNSPYDAAILHPNGRAYFFKGEKYHRYDFSLEKVDKVGDIGESGWKGLVTDLDAAVNHPNGKAYFFAGSKYYRFDFGAHKVDKVGDIGKSGWAGLVTNLDAAVNHPNGKAYFFKGDKYYRFDFGADKVDKVGDIGRSGWAGLVSNLDAAVNHPNGKAYFFKGDKYYRFDFGANKVDRVGDIGDTGWKGL